jgi:hypothetical protein
MQRLHPLLILSLLTTACGGPTRAQLAPSENDRSTTQAALGSHSVSPTELHFGNQTVGTTSADRLVTFTNTGTTPMTIAVLVAAPNPMSLDPTGLNFNLEPGESSSFIMRFIPKEAQSYAYKLSYEIYYPEEHRLSGELFIPVTGTGVAP